MSDAGDVVVPNDALSADDRAALGWAVSTEHPIAVELVSRVRSGGTGVLACELSAVVADWDRAGRPLPESHVHRTKVTFVDGTEVSGVTFVADDPYTRDDDPSFGLYLDERWHPPWAHAHIDWPDFGVPTDPAGLGAALHDLLDQARSGHSVEIGCLGGHGRTGTALACMAVMTGTPASEAVDWVRAHYCPKAIETDEQAAFVANFPTNA